MCVFRGERRAGRGLALIARQTDRIRWKPRFSGRSRESEESVTTHTRHCLGTAEPDGIIGCSSSCLSSAAYLPGGGGNLEDSEHFCTSHEIIMILAQFPGELMIISRAGLGGSARRARSGQRILIGRGGAWSLPLFFSPATTH